jgi:type I restriction enzyme, R subunit
VAFETGGSKWQPRCYQHNAITSVLEAIARGERRILLTLATGTGGCRQAVRFRRRP